MAVLVTGGAGYIGSHMVALLHEAGEEVVALDNLSTGFAQSIKGTKLIRCDLLDTTDVADAMRENNVDSVIHFAAKTVVPESMADPVKYYYNNLAGTICLLKAMEEAGAKHIVFSSSAAVYGQQEEMPISEDAPKRPSSVYGTTKLMMEQVIGDVAGITGIGYCAMRYFNASGAHPSGDIGEAHNPESHLIPCIIKSMLEKRDFELAGTDYPTQDGTCVRDYIHVCDLADAHLLALRGMREGTAGGAYNLGSGTGYSNRQIIEAVSRVSGIKVNVAERGRRPGDPPVLVASAEKAKRELGWKPKYNNLEDIVSTALNWHTKHPNGYGD